MRRGKTPKLSIKPAARPSARANGGSLAEGRRVLKIEALPIRRGPPAEARTLYSELTSEAGQA